MQPWAHNVLLNDGSRTVPEQTELLTDQGWFRSALATMIAHVPPEGDAQPTVIDVGCLEGGYAAGFARAGYDAVGLDARQSNLDRCSVVAEGVDLPNLRFVHGDARELEQLGVFDIVFCCGLLYHLDGPVEFLRAASAATKRLLLVHTHFAPDDNPSTADAVERYRLSAMTLNEGKLGRCIPSGLRARQRP